MKLLSKGTEFAVTDNSNELWVKAKIGGAEGYIYREYTDISLKLSKEEVPKPIIPDDPETPDWYNSSVLDSVEGATNEKPITPVEVYIADDNVTIEERASYTLTVFSSDPTIVSSVSFKSSNTSVATVSQNGVVKGVAPGTASITAYMEGSGEFSSCKVTVIKSTT
ncbi:MAG: Ig-like domain-containing protein, partial [Ruminococcus sp.]|nr:Ig-like domain-containing protein [Ruminococcus sp.]